MGKLVCPHIARGHQPPATEAALTYGHFHRLNIPGIKKCYAKTHTNQKLRQFCPNLAGYKHSGEGTGSTGHRDQLCTQSKGAGHLASAGAIAHRKNFLYRS